MQGLSENQLLLTFLAIAVLLLAARGMAELTRKLGQPEVLGELLGGFLIGPSVLGALMPATYTSLFLNPAVSHALSLLSWIGAILLLMIAGMEADLTILREKAVPGLLAAAGAVGASLGDRHLYRYQGLWARPIRRVFPRAGAVGDGSQHRGEVADRAGGAPARLCPGDACRRHRRRGAGLAAHLGRLIGAAPIESVPGGPPGDGACELVSSRSCLRLGGDSPFGRCAVWRT